MEERFTKRGVGVDDEEQIGKLIASLIASLLSTKGHQCITARNGLEALDKIAENEFNAVISDVVMPEMDGIVLIKELSKHYQSLPVVVAIPNQRCQPETKLRSKGSPDPGPPKASAAPRCRGPFCHGVCISD